MIKHTVTYKDFDNVEQTTDVYFNLTKTELLVDMDISDLQVKAEFLTQMASGNKRELSIDEIRFAMKFIRDLMAISYGIRDGQRFVKSPEIWQEFQETPAYDAYFFSLFEDISRGMEWIKNIMPGDWMEAVRKEQPDLFKELDESLSPIPSAEVVAEVRKADDEAANIPSWQRENRVPTVDEFSKMTDAERAQAFAR